MVAAVSVPVREIEGQPSGRAFACHARQVDLRRLAAVVSLEDHPSERAFACNARQVDLRSLVAVFPRLVAVLPRLVAVHPGFP